MVGSHCRCTRTRVHRPGQLERFIPGISTKVLTERLRRMLVYGLITRTEYPGLPLRVEYHLTPVGEKLASVIEQLRASKRSLHARQSAAGRADG